MWVLMGSFSFIVDYTKENNIGISDKICLWIIYIYIYIYILRLKDTMKRYSFICICVLWLISILFEKEKACDQ